MECLNEMLNRTVCLLGEHPFLVTDTLDRGRIVMTGPSSELARSDEVRRTDLGI